MVVDLLNSEALLDRIVCFACHFGIFYMTLITDEDLYWPFYRGGGHGHLCLISLIFDKNIYFVCVIFLIMERAACLGRSNIFRLQELDVLFIERFHYGCI